MKSVRISFDFILQEIIMSTSQLTTMLWFDNEAEDAAKYYTSIFKNSSIKHVQYYPEAGKEQHQKQLGSVMVVSFEINGQSFVGLNGGPQFKFTPAISFVINCEDQNEVDYYWEKLSEGGDPTKQACGMSLKNVKYINL